jgi:hypothetical protein
MNHKEIPDGFREDAKGSLVPVSKIKDVDLLRDELVMEIVGKARALREALVQFKNETFGDISAFVDLSAEKYGLTIGGGKGNLTLTSFDGRYKVQRQNSEYIVFDERLQVAKELIDLCIHAWSTGSSDNLRVLVNDAFSVDKAGKINTGRILGLRRLNISDDAWQRAMQAISDAVQVAGSKLYVRVYERVGDSDRYEPIGLDIAGV